MADLPVVVVPPQPAASPVSYAGGALVTGFLAPTLQIIIPAWSPQQATAVATCGVVLVGMIHMLLQWYLTWRYPTAPPLPTVLK